MTTIVVLLFVLNNIAVLYGIYVITDLLKRLGNRVDQLFEDTEDDESELP